MKSELALRDSEKSFLTKEIELLQEQLKHIKQKSQEERKQLKERYDELNRDLS